MLTLEILGVLFALLILFFGAETTLKSSERLGRALGLSPLAIGILIIGFGTSLPEFFVSQIASMDGKSALALGNLIGSNIANSLLILGIAASFCSIPMSGKNLWGQLIFHGALHVTVYFLIAPPELSMTAKLILLGFFVTYIIFSIQNDFKHMEERVKKLPFKWKDLGLFLVGVVMLFIGGEVLVSQGSSLGRSLGVSEYFISVIFISFGTSFPELVTSILACVRKKEVSLVIGNILGSNFFNLSFVLGSLVFSKVEISQNYEVEFSLMMGVSVLFFLFALIQRVPRASSIFLLGGYGAMIYFWSTNQ